MKHKQFLLAGLFGLGFLSLLRPTTPPLRGQLLDIRKVYGEARERAELNLRNQFTPGFKSRSQWGGESNLNWSQGEIFKTQTATNLAINGAGCFGLECQGQIAYTRDGRFAFREGLLKTADGWSLLGTPLDSLGNISGEAGPIRLDMDPCTNLYFGRYTGFHFDETGKLHGESTLTDPVTGQQLTTNTPLFQLLLFQFPNSSGLADQSGSSHNIWVPNERSGQAVSGIPGQGALGGVCPGSLELSNVDFMSEGTTLMWISSHGRAFAAKGPASPIQQELLSQIQSDSRLRRAVLDNLTHQLTPGYRSWDLLGYLQTGELKFRSQAGTHMATHRAFDVALEGPAMLVLDSGEITRNGHLIWNKNGLACGEPNGALLMGYAGQSQKLEPVRIPAQAANLEITLQGEVRWVDLTGDGQPQSHYRLALARLEQEQQMTRSGLHLRPTGPLTYGVAGPAMGTSIQQGFLETPNGDLYEEGLEAGALLELAGLPPFFVDDLRQPDARQRALAKLAF